MVGASGIGFYAEPANPRRVDALRMESERSKALSAEKLPLAGGVDDASLSETATLLAKANAQDEHLQEERLSQIRQSLEQGTYRVQEVMLHVAARVAKYVE